MRHVLISVGTPLYNNYMSHFLIKKQWIEEEKEKGLVGQKPPPQKT